MEGGELWTPPSLNPLMPLSIGTKAGVLGLSSGFSVAVLMFLLLVMRLEMRRLFTLEGAGVGGNW